MKDYQKYQLQWMIDHGHSLEELIDELDRCKDDWAENNESITDIFKAWEQNIGFGSEIWACQEEAEDCGETKSASRLEIPLSDGHSLVAEINPDSNYKEIFLSVSNKEKTWLQDLAIVREAYVYEDLNVVPKSERYEVLVYGDAEKLDYTHRFEIPIFKEYADEEEKHEQLV